LPAHHLGQRLLLALCLAGEFGTAVPKPLGRGDERGNELEDGLGACCIAHEREQVDGRKQSSERRDRSTPSGRVEIQPVQSYAILANHK
jgi:hypothetical protein